MLGTLLAAGVGGRQACRIGGGRYRLWLQYEVRSDDITVIIMQVKCYLISILVIAYLL